MTDTVKYEAIFKDENQVPRVWGTGSTEIEAQMQAQEALNEYLRGLFKHGIRKSPHAFTLAIRQHDGINYIL